MGAAVSSSRTDREKRYLNRQLFKCAGRGRLLFKNAVQLDLLGIRIEDDDKQQADTRRKKSQC